MLSTHVPYPRQTVQAIVQIEGDQIVARNRTGVIQTGALTTLTTVVEAVMTDDLTSGRTWQETIRIVGNYELDDRITMQSNVRLELDGQIKVADGVAFATAHLIYAAGIDNCSVSGGTWDSNGVNHDGDDGSAEAFHQFAISLNGCDDWLFENVTVLNAGRDAFVFYNGSTRIRCISCTSDGSEDDGFNPLDASDVQFISCVAKNSVNDGFHISTDSTDIVVIGGLTTGNGQYGLECISDRLKVIGLTCNGVVHVNGNAGDILIRDCIIDAAGFDESAIIIGGDDTDKRVSIIGCSVKGIDAGNRGIYNSGRRDCIFRDNIVTGTTGSYGIFLNACDNNLLEGNLVDGTFTTSNIRVYSTCENTILRNNISRGGVTGLEIDSDAVDTLLDSNNLDGSTVGLEDNSPTTVRRPFPRTQEVTAIVGGATTGLIDRGINNVVVTSTNADHQISLPAASIGDEIWVQMTGTACEMISAVATAKINNVVVGATNELALVDTSSYLCKYVATDTWIVRGWDNVGADEGALVPNIL